MLRIRKAQMEALSRAVAGDYEDRMVTHLARFFPEESSALGEGAVRERIRLGVARAAAHGVDGERDVCLFLNLMIALGPDFNRDPALPEVRALFEDETRDGPSRLGRVYDWAERRERGEVDAPEDDGGDEGEA